MFFYIGTNCPIKSIEQKTSNVFLDKGWENTLINNKNFWYKGYSTECVLGNSLDKIILGYKPAGKWVLISEEGNIYHPILRGFPLYGLDNNKTNIPLSGYNEIKYPIKKITRNESSITLDEASILINNILKENIINFFNFNKIDRLRVLFSAGIDTLTVWSIVENLNFDYDLYIHQRKPNNVFGVKEEYKSDLINLCREKFWGYKMTSCFVDPNYYITGFYSERIQLREVSQGHIIANYKNKKLCDIPKSTDYLYWFLQRPTSKLNNSPYVNSEEQVFELCNESVFYDNQMWHIDHNYHFSPFYDLRITEVVNRLSLEDIITNALNAVIQKNIIKMNRPDFLLILSDFKNSKNIWKNYNQNFKNINLRSCVNKFIS